MPKYTSERSGRVGVRENSGQVPVNNSSASMDKWVDMEYSTNSPPKLFDLFSNETIYPSVAEFVERIVNAIQIPTYMGEIGVLVVQDKDQKPEGAISDLNKIIFDILTEFKRPGIPETKKQQLAWLKDFCEKYIKIRLSEESIREAQILNEMTINPEGAPTRAAARAAAIARLGIKSDEEFQASNPAPTIGGYRKKSRKSRKSKKSRKSQKQRKTRSR